MSETAYHQQQAELTWATIGAMTFRKPVRFRCGHHGTIGTKDKRLCASCALEAKRDRAKSHVFRKRR